MVASGGYPVKVQRANIGNDPAKAQAVAQDLIEIQGHRHRVQARRVRFVANCFVIAGKDSETEASAGLEPNCPARGSSRHESTGCQVSRAEGSAFAIKELLPAQEAPQSELLEQFGDDIVPRVDMSRNTSTAPKPGHQSSFHPIVVRGLFVGKLDGKVALITGGARGQGRAHAIRMAEEGAQIVVTDIADQIPSVPYPLATKEDLDETVRAVEALDQRCLAIRADARDSAAMDAVVERAVNEFGHLDIAVVNHGVSGDGRWDAPEQTLLDVIDVNLKGSLFAARSAIRQFIAQQRGGSLVFTSSIAGIRAYHGNTAYCASKHGVIGLMRALSADMAQHWIRVNAVCPGTVDTPMMINDYGLSLFSGLETGGTRETVDFAARSLNLLPEPFVHDRDIANAVLFLVSDDARFLTGVALPVDAGSAMQPPGIPPIASEAIARLSANGPAPFANWGR